MIPTKQALEALAEELRMNPDKFEQKLAESEDDEDGFEKVRVYLLGALDRGVRENHIDTETARRHYGTLGFTPDEMSKIRQNVALDPATKGEGL